ncbi:MAG: c-type cytochrome [Gemmatimonadales bacterium]|nr:c-type cytochrome [Gemmatimonadales bacterium]
MRAPAFHSRRLMESGAFAVALAMALLLWSDGRAAAQELPGLTQNPLAGAQVFGAKGCVRCHSVNGLGGKVGPDLGQIPQRRSFYELAATMWNHLPRMGEEMRERGIERPEMSAQDVADLIAFLFTIDYFDAPGDVEGGQRLFNEKKCVVCHQVGSYGGVFGPNLDFLGNYGSPILVAAAMWNHGPKMTEAMRARGLERPTFRGSELTDLIAYLESVSPEPLEGSLYVLPGRAADGRVIFVEKGCIQCHSVAGRGGRRGGDLADRGRQLGLMEFAAAMWNKAPSMTSAMRELGISLPHLGAVEMADLVAYLYSVQYFAEAGEAESGQRRLREKGCTRCHLLKGQGGKSAPDLALVKGMDSAAAVISSLWNHALVMQAAMESQGIAWPTFRPQDMADIAAFFEATVAER